MRYLWHHSVCRQKCGAGHKTPAAVARQLTAEVDPAPHTALTDLLEQEQHPLTNVNAPPVELRMDNAEHVLLRLDDELAGLVEAAGIPADQGKAHPTKPEPEPASPVAG